MTSGERMEGKHDNTPWQCQWCGRTWVGGGFCSQDCANEYRLRITLREPPLPPTPPRT